MQPNHKLRSGIRSGIRRLLRWTERALAVVGLAALIYHWGFDVSTVTSGSMSPTLLGNSVDDGDVVLTERFSYMFRQPRRWEIVTFVTDQGVQVMKRVVGLPGESVSMPQRTPIIDGELCALPEELAYVRYWALGNLFGNREVQCGQGYFVLGDDSRDSQDSRFEGPVMPERVRGRAWLRIWPLHRLGTLTPQTQGPRGPVHRRRVGGRPAEVEQTPRTADLPAGLKDRATQISAMSRGQPRKHNAGLEAGPT